MASQTSTWDFKCPKCKAKGEITVEETDHPYQTESYATVTRGFTAKNVLALNAKVFCDKCKVEAK